MKNFSFLLLLSLFFVSCDFSQKQRDQWAKHCNESYYLKNIENGEIKEKKSLNMIEVKQEEQSKIDSVVVVYWKSTEANEYQFYYSDKILQIRSEYFGFKKSVENKQSIQTFLKYINLFYIDKEKEIVLNRTKRDYLESTDYPNIKVIGYKNKKEVFNINTQIGEEEYDVEFNPKFLEFYEFLDNLVKQK